MGKKELPGLMIKEENLVYAFAGNVDLTTLNVVPEAKSKSFIEMDKKTPFTMHFRDTKLESEFTHFYYNTGSKVAWYALAKRFKISLFLAALLWCFFIPADILVTREKEDRFILGIVLRLVMIPVTVFYVVFIFIPKVSRSTLLVELTGCLVIVGYIATICVKATAFTFSSPAFPIGTMLTCLIAYTLPRPRLHVVYSIGLVGVIAYVGSSIGFNWTELSGDGDVGQRRIILFMFAITFTQLLGILQVKQVERYFRKLFIYQRQLKAKQSIMKSENQRQMSLLHNILPEQYVPLVHDENLRFVCHYERATVLTSDIENFTIFTSNSKPELVIAMLNEHFSFFDDFAAMYRLVKLKTVGDAYIAYCIEDSEEDGHDINVRTCDMSIMMHRGVKLTNEKLNLDVKIRVGIACGELMVGVIGREKITFDSWGKTLLVAEEMESSSIPGSSQISKQVYDTVRDNYSFQPNGNCSSGFPKYVITSKLPYSERRGLPGSKPLTPSPEFKEEIAIGGQQPDSDPTEDLSKQETTDEVPLMKSLKFVFKEKFERHKAKMRSQKLSFKNAIVRKMPKEKSNASENVRYDLRRSRILLFFLSMNTYLDYVISSYPDMVANIRSSLTISTIMFAFIVSCQIVLFPAKADHFALIIQYVGFGIHIFTTCFYWISSIVWPLVHARASSELFGVIHYFSGIASVILAYLTTFLVCTSVLLDNELQSEFLGLCLMWAMLSIHMYPMVPWLMKVIFSVVYFVGMIVGAFVGYEYYSKPRGELEDFFLLLALTLASLLFGCVNSHIIDNSSIESYLNRRKMEMEMGRIALEQEKSKYLILSVLPEKILRRVVTKGHDLSRSQPLVYSIKNGTAIFCGLSGFYEECLKHENATVAMKTLNEIFVHFDNLVESMDGCHKIKSIASTYLVVTGLDGGKQKTDREIYYFAEQAARLSVLMKEGVKSIVSKNSKLKSSWKVRIGIYTGDFICAIVGTKRYLFDSFGNTINISARLYQTGQPNTINFTKGLTYDAMTSDSPRYDITFHTRGVVNMKGKGDLTTYILESCDEKRLKPPTPDDTPINIESANNVQQYVVNVNIDEEPTENIDEEPTENIDEEPTVDQH